MPVNDLNISDTGLSQENVSALQDFNLGTNTESCLDSLINNTVYTTASETDSERKKREEDEALQRKLMMNSPEYQAFVVYRQLTDGKIMSGSEKRRIRRQCERDAKKGKYKKFFDEELIAKREERNRKKFAEVNGSEDNTVK